MKTILLNLFLISLFFISPASADNNPDQQPSSEFPSKLPDEFQSLSELRQKVLARQSALENELNKLKEELKYLPRTTHDIDSKIEELKTRISQDKKVIADLEKKEGLNEEERNKLEDLKTYVVEDERTIKRYIQEKVRLIELEQEIKDGDQRLSSINNYSDNVALKIANLLNIEEERNSFRKLISFTFCALVAIVIVGFYVIAFKKGNIAESIFSGEKGIQFVAIFLIVIAIILFGIMGILESKELSALLGGLSGYILGRVGKQTSSPNPAKPDDL